MADFATHLGWGAVAAGLGASATFAADIVPAQHLMTLTLAGVVGSVLPDIDLEKTVPSRLLFTGLGFFLAFLAMFNFKSTYSILELWIIWFGVFVSIRYAAYHIFHENTVHRGIFHSILAGLFFMVATTVLCAYGLGLPAVVSWMAGFFVLCGFLIHLTLDEIYSVDFTGARIKRSFGSALKLYQYNSPSSSILMAGALIALLMISPPSAEFRSIMKPSQVTKFFYERMLPQDGWFKGRMAQAPTASDIGGVQADIR
ncbi:MAG: metal-dependent hydrolase [Hyphomicrobiales bacterium]|nr:metal-dependent hydrolase [Hyphomicrobiales bacterium]